MLNSSNKMSLLPCEIGGIEFEQLRENKMNSVSRVFSTVLSVINTPPRIYQIVKETNKSSSFTPLIHHHLEHVLKLQKNTFTQKNDPPKSLFPPFGG